MLLNKYIDNQYLFGIEPITMAAIAGGSALGQIGAGYLGSQAASKSQKEALALAKKIYGQANRIAVPTIAEQKLDLEMLKSLGNFSPEQLETLNYLGDTALSDIEIDPRLKNAQMQALEQIGDVVSSRGLTQQDLSSLEQIRRRSAAENTAKQAAISQEMAQRGQLGSGMEMAAKLSAAQGSDTSMQDLEIAKNAQQRALEAISQQASMAGGIRSQEYSEALNEAKAKDLINQFNTQYAQNTAQQNWASRNQANMYNLEKAQNTANQNVALRNQQQQANKALIQQMFGNQVAKVNAMAGAAAPVQNALSQQAASQAGMYAGIGQAIGGAGSAVLDYYGKQKAKS